MDKNVIESSVQRPNDNLSKTLVLRWSMTNDLLPAWWSATRDRYLREYWPTEDFLASTIYSVTARNMQFTWNLTGLDSDVAWAQRLLQSADWGKGWNTLIQKTSLDFLTQDNGAFWEIIRPARVLVDGKRLPAIKQYNEESESGEWYAVKENGLQRLAGRDYKIYDSPLDLPIGIAYLDSGQVQRTGNPDIPFLYTDRYGKIHRMRPWQVVDFVDMESTIETMNGVGLCATSRVFRSSHILQSATIHKDEKISGRYNKAIHITNADADLLSDQIQQTQIHANNLGASRYIQPVIASTFSPDATPAVATIELAGYPDGFDESNTNTWATTVLALGFGVDYGFLAPLPGKGLGTAAQSETQAKQAKGKSSRQFQSMVTQALNFRGILPASVNFEYDENDVDALEKQTKMSKTRAETRKQMQENGEITPSVSRQMAVDEGDLNEAYLEMMGDEDETPVTTAEGEVREISEEDMEESEKCSCHHQGELQTEIDYEQVKETKERLFKKTGIFAKIFNVASRSLWKKQIQTPETPSQEISQALELYADELEELVLAAQSGELEQEDFEEQLTALVISALLAIYAESLGIDPDDLTDADLTPVENILAKNEESVGKISDDIYSGRYDEEDGLGIAPLIGRLGLWVGSAASIAWLGTIFNDNNAQNKYMWVLNPFKENCESCLALDGQIHTGAEWADFGVAPRSRRLFCNGFNCGCSFRDMPQNTPTRGDLGSVPLN